jgi:hypothetical protein
MRHLLAFRNIGPANPGERIDDIAAVESDPRIMYVGTAAAAFSKRKTAA